MQKRRLTNKTASDMRKSETKVSKEQSDNEQRKQDEKQQRSTDGKQRERPNTK